MAEPPGTPDDVDLSAADRAQIDGMYLRLATTDLYELLGVARGSDRKTIRDAYFALSQRFHPDAYFGKRLGPWKARIEEVFRELTRAYDVLGNKNRRAEYDATLPPPAPGTAAPAPAPAPAPAAAPRAAPQPPAPPATPYGAATARALATPTPPSAPPADRSGPFPVASSPADPNAPVAPMQRAGETSGRMRPPVLPPEPNDPNQPLPPMQRPGETSGRMRPPVVSPEPSRSSANVQIDAESARRAAREALARKLAAGRGPSGTMPAVRPNAPPTPPVAPASPAPPGATALDSLQAFRNERIEAERRARVAQLVRKAEEAMAQNDYVAAANALGMATTIEPENVDLKARAAQAAQRMAESQVDKNVAGAREAERGGHWEVAAMHWQRASTGRPKDVGLLERAALALVRANKDLQRAAELARRANQIAPQRAESLTVLAQVFLAAGMKVSAVNALEAATKLDPNSLVVKDLLTKAKG